jgi:hypothetical protein
MLTRENERLQKCPIQTCCYHTRGFARRYDRTATSWCTTMGRWFSASNQAQDLLQGQRSAVVPASSDLDLSPRCLTLALTVTRDPIVARSWTTLVLLVSSSDITTSSHSSWHPALEMKSSHPSESNQSLDIAAPSPSPSSRSQTVPLSSSSWKPSWTLSHHTSRCWKHASACSVPQLCASTPC